MTVPALIDCRQELFPLVESRLGGFTFGSEPAGCQRLEATLRLAAEHSEDALATGAQIFAAIVGQRPFSRGNEALAVTLLGAHLLRNGFRVAAPSVETVREQLQWLFPKLRWEERPELSQPHEFFFYHLAAVLTDPTQKGPLTVAQEQAAVRHLLTIVATPA